MYVELNILFDIFSRANIKKIVGALVYEFIFYNYFFKFKLNTYW